MQKRFIIAKNPQDEKYGIYHFIDVMTKEKRKSRSTYPAPKAEAKPICGGLPNSRMAGKHQKILEERYGFHQAKRKRENHDQNE